MGNTLALLHTSPVLVPVFQALAGDLAVFHMVDESLLQNTIRAGVLEKTTIRRVIRHIESAREAGAGAVLVTCSSIGAAVPVARQLFDFPVIRVDERMARRAIESGTRIGVLATLRSTLEPTAALIRDTASKQARDVAVVTRLCEGAFQAVTRGDTAGHDAAVLDGLESLGREVDVVVLAQASMARVAGALPVGARQVAILSSPALAMEDARERLLQKIG
ncbi:MAG: Asp/Glu/hydantoin racemase [Bryobacterales bacterium]|nr:Asp/Glu/hydantoin racemase [Bryobacterales bacterium]